MEEKAIERISKHYGLVLVKNEEPLENEYFTGTYDTKRPKLLLVEKCLLIVSPSLILKRNQIKIIMVKFKFTRN